MGLDVVGEAICSVRQEGMVRPILIDADNGGYHSDPPTARANSDNLLLSCHDGDPFLSRFNIDARARADSLDQLGAAVKAISEKARLSGLWAASTQLDSEQFRFAPRTWPCVRWQSDGAEIHACDWRPKEIHHETAGGGGAAGLGCRHHGSRLLFGSNPRGDAAVGIHSRLSAPLAPATG